MPAKSGRLSGNSANSAALGPSKAVCNRDDSTSARSPKEAFQLDQRCKRECSGGQWWSIMHDFTAMEFVEAGQLVVRHTQQETVAFHAGMFQSQWNLPSLRKGGTNNVQDDTGSTARSLSGEMLTLPLHSQRQPNPHLHPIGWLRAASARLFIGPAAVGVRVGLHRRHVAEPRGRRATVGARVELERRGVELRSALVHVLLAQRRVAERSAAENRPPLHPRAAEVGRGGGG